MMNKGFSLLELLVTVSILGILSAISVQNFLEYRLKAYQFSIISDSRNLFMAVNAHFIDNETPAHCTDIRGDKSNPFSCQNVLPGFKWSPGNCGRVQNGSLDGYFSYSLSDPFSQGSKYNHWYYHNGDNDSNFWGGFPGAGGSFCALLHS